MLQKKYFSDFQKVFVAVLRVKNSSNIQRSNENIQALRRRKKCKRNLNNPARYIKVTQNGIWMHGIMSLKAAQNSNLHDLLKRLNIGEMLACQYPLQHSCITSATEAGYGLML